MPFSLILMPLLLAQAGSMVGDGPAPGLNLPQIDRPSGPNRRRGSKLIEDDLAADAANHTPSRLASCLQAAGTDPDATVDTASKWLHETTGPAQVEPQLCLGIAYSGLGAWTEAESAFLSGRASAAPEDHLHRARLGAMAGNAALADGEPVRALTTLDSAATEARAAQNPLLIGEIEIDRSRALVALHREADALSELAGARAAAPDNPLGWLLSATLSRRMGKLAEAQTQIETAARLAPTDPEIGLEAGVIAVLAGHDEAARKDWQSVLAIAPQREAGTQASAYLAQLGPPAAASPAPDATAPHP